MFRFALALLIFLAIILTNCTPSRPEEGSTPTSAASTASVSTVEPVIITPFPPDYTPPPTSPLPTQTPIPTLPGELSPTELKYRILEEYPDFFYCDPDYYPVARADELDLAVQRFPELQADSEEFNAILAHNNLAGKSTFSDEEKLLIYREHKKLAAIRFDLVGDAYQFQITSAKAEGEGQLITASIDGEGAITVLDKTASIATCPICLAAGTLIDTPAGPIPVQSLQPGMLVWTLDAAGKRIVQPIVQVGKAFVPASHQVVHLVLDDGRELYVSPGHPTADGLTAGELKAGGRLDGGIILSAQPVSYNDTATYDLLPDGSTGLYWANGILLASTLDQPESQDN
jgi:Hint domain